MKLGTIIRLPDGRIGTVVYNGLDGVGTKWGRHNPNPADFAGSTGGLVETPPEVRRRLAEWMPDAMLRKPYPMADLECVGDVYEILRLGLDDYRPTPTP